MRQLSADAAKPAGAQDCASGPIKIEPSLYLSVVANEYVDPPPASLQAAGSVAARPQVSPNASYDKCATTYYCCAAFLNSAPANGNLRDPKSPTQTYVSANCYSRLNLTGVDALTSISVTFNAFKYNARGSAAGSKTVDPGPCVFVKNIIDGTYCETKHATVPLVTGHSEISRPVATVVDTTGDRDTTQLSGELDLNDNAVDYPRLNESASGYGPGVVPFPAGTFYNCRAGYATYPPCTRASAAFRSELITHYRQVGWAIPSGVSGNPATYDAHHIQPLAWGGNNSSLNGIFLTNHYSTTDDHQIFSTWWCSFSLPNAASQSGCTGFE